MGLLPHRFNFPFRHRPSSLRPPPPPPEFLCSISGELMSDPVILPSGQTFERACIEASRDFSSSSSSSSSSSLLLIPNSALRSAIIRWCDLAGVPRPIPISPEAAARLALDSHAKCSTELPNQNTSFSSSDQSSSSSSSSETAPVVPADPPEETIIPKLKPAKIDDLNKPPRRFPPNPKSHAKCSTELPNQNTSSSFSDHSSSSSSSSETPIAADPLEETIIAAVKTAKIEDLDKALISILESSRESAARRAALCTSRLLAALRGLLLSKHLSTQSTALAIIVNLSLEPPNKIKIVRSGAIPAIIAALHSPSRPHAAGALFSLALEAQNRTPIGVLGAVPPLLRLFADPNNDSRTRIESGMALLHLCFAEINTVKIIRISGVVKSLINVAKDDFEVELRRIAMRLMVSIVGNKEGKSVMLDGGALEAMILFLNKKEGGGEEKGMAVVILYGMSMAGLRFRGIGRRVGAEDLLERVAEGFEGEKREMLMVIVRVLRGEERERERDVARVLWGAAEEEEEGVVEEKVVVDRRRLNRDSGGGLG